MLSTVAIFLSDDVYFILSVVFFGSIVVFNVLVFPLSIVRFSLLNFNEVAATLSYFLAVIYTTSFSFLPFVSCTTKRILHASFPLGAFFTVYLLKSNV